MITFTTSILESWKSNGYKYIYILPLKKYGVLQPLNQEKENKKGYSIHIHELHLINLSEDYFLTKEKDGIKNYPKLSEVEIGDFAKQHA